MCEKELGVEIRKEWEKITRRLISEEKITSADLRQLEEAMELAVSFWMAQATKTAHLATLVVLEDVFKPKT